MVKKILASLFKRPGAASSGASENAPQPVDPKTLLFSIPTLSNDLAELEKIDGPVKPTDLLLNEDDWAQVEFFSRHRVAELKEMLKEYKKFEANNRLKVGWKNVYARHIERQPVIGGADALTRIEALLGVNAIPGPVVVSVGRIGGRVKGGFVLPLGGNVAIYGYRNEAGIPVLAVSVGDDPDNRQVTNAFAALNAQENAVLVDWQQQFILENVASNGMIEVWRPD